jgi:glycosyltransferase involved in cell wall biosynthesis
LKESIVIVNSSYYPNIVGGAEISTQILAESLTEIYDVYVITTGPHSRKQGVREITNNNVTILQLPCNNLYWPFDGKEHHNIKKMLWHFINILNYLQYKELIRILNRIKPVIVHTQNLPGISFAIWKAAGKLNIPVIHTTRDYSLFAPIKTKAFNNFFVKFAKKFSGNVKAVIGISEYVLNQHIHQGLFASTPKFFISNVVLGTTFPRVKENIPGPLKIGFFGQIAEIKGVKILVEAVNKLSNNVISEVYICGEGPLKKELQSLNNNRIKVTGKLSPEDVRKIMEKVDLTVVPSKWGEPFGRVLIESYQCGTPVFATKDGGIPEIIFKPELFLLEEKDSESIVEALKKYQKCSVEQRLVFQRECYEYSKKFDLRESLEKHLKIYKEFKRNKDE